MIDLEAIRQRALAEKKGATLTLAIVGADTDAGIEAKRVLGAVVDIYALLAEVERLQRLVGGMSPCSKCGTIHLVRKGFTIDAQRNRYPNALQQLPNRIVLYGGSKAVAEKIVNALDDYLIAGSGCDHFYILAE